MNPKKATVFLAIVCLLTQGSVAATIITVDNSNPDYKKAIEGKERSAEVVKAGYDEVVQKSAGTLKYIKENGVKKAIEEMNKGKEGALAENWPKEYCYYSIEKVLDGTKGKVVGCNVKSFIGWEFDASKVNGVDNWNYKGEYWKAATERKKEYWDATKKQGQILVKNVVFTDPGWANGKACRFNVLLTYFEADGELYYIFFTHWIDE